MSLDVFDVYAKLTLDTSEYDRSIDDAKDQANVFASVLGANLATKGIGLAIEGLKKLGEVAVDTFKQAMSAYADYEQLIGGVETLFKDSADTVEQYANEAYKTAGLSANQYMETVTSFSAALIQSLEGDTKKAAEIADMAIRDMSDNANKMGTSMSAIQTAYQGFAKQNYTMLDNLKLGYGGTKEEMERVSLPNTRSNPTRTSWKRSMLSRMRWGSPERPPKKQTKPSPEASRLSRLHGEI